MQGGVGDYSRELALGLAQRDVTVRVLTSQAAAEMDASPHAPPVQVDPAIAKWNWTNLPAIRNRVREFAPDLVHIQYQTGAFGMHPAINLLPRYFHPRPGGEGRAPRRGLTPQPRVVTTFHDLRIPYLFPKAGPVREWVTRLLALSSDAVIATAEPDYVRLKSWRVPQVSLIPIGSNITTSLPPEFDRAQWRARLGVSEGENLLAHFGFVNERKGCDTLLHALTELPRARLIMIGGQIGASDQTNVAALTRLKSLIQELDLAERVLWTGFLPPEQVTANLHAADLCVLPYREGASYQHGTLMAALAHSLPIITTTLPATRPIVSTPLPALRDDENCLLVPPDNPHVLAQTIQRALSTPELTARLSHGACELAQYFSWDHIVRQHLELYARLLPHP